jgi:hypothetical protein
MSIQAIINTATKIAVDRRRVVGQSISRSQRIKTATRNSAQPWKLTITPAPIYAWDIARPYIEYIQNTDKNTEVVVKLSDNPRMSFLTQYQGVADETQLAAMTVTNFTGTTMTVGGLPAIGSSALLFGAGDIIQPRFSRYPYVVAEPVLRGSETTVNVKTNRPLITSENTTITNTLLVGTQTSFTMVVTQMPTYEFAQKNRVNFSGDFELVEKII